MSIPYSVNLSWNFYKANTERHKEEPLAVQNPSEEVVNQTKRAVNEAFVKTFKQAGVRGVQFIRDGARLVLKVPIRSILTPIILPKNWKERERAKVNVKLTAYSFIQLFSVPVKFFVALTALAISAFSYKKAQWLLDKSETYTSRLDGRASQLEALKEEGRVNASDREEYNLYRIWLYNIDPKLCHKN